MVGVPFGEGRAWCWQQWHGDRTGWGTCRSSGQRSGGGTLGHDIVVGEQSTTLGEFIHIGGVHLRVVVAYISPTLVIGENNDTLGWSPKI